jgi:hypothetical protein
MPERGSAPGLSQPGINLLANTRIVLNEQF